MILKLVNEQGDVKIEATCDFLQLTLSELALVFDLTPEQLSPELISSSTKVRIQSLVGAMEFVAENFNGDITKVKKWFNSSNLNFGGTSPRTLMLAGRIHKVIQFIQATKEGY